MPTIETKISQAIQARVATCLPDFQKVWTEDIVWENGKPVGLPTENNRPAPYIEAHFEPNRTARPFVGSKEPNDHPGILRMTLCWPIALVGTGSGRTHRNVVREWAGKIAVHFGTDKTLTFQGTGVRVTKWPDVLGSYRDETYMRTPVRIDLEGQG